MGSSDNDTVVWVAKVQITPNSLYDQDGFLYSGVVDAVLKVIEPAGNTTLSLNLPSDLMAVDSDGNVTGLLSFGMFALQLRSLSGEVLISSDAVQVMVNGEHTGEQPEPRSLSKLWVLNPSTGYWEYSSDLVQPTLQTRSKRETSCTKKHQV